MLINPTSILRRQFPLVFETGTAEALDRELAARLLAFDSNRWRHSLGALHASELLGPLLGEPAFCRRLCQAALFHDIGYCPTLRITGFHPLDGALFLAAHRASSEVVLAVLHHSGAAAESIHYPAARSVYAAVGHSPHSLLTDALTVCDLHTSPQGNMVSIDERVREVVARHGSESVAAKRLVLFAASFRTRSRRC